MSNEYNHEVKLIEDVSLDAALLAVGKPYKNQKTTEKLLHNVIVVRKHESVSEHITFKFDISGISRAVLQELARHRIGSFTVESSRFCLNKITNNYKKDMESLASEESKKQNDVKEIISKYFNMDLTNKSEKQKNSMIIAATLVLNVLVSLSETGLSNDDIKPFLPEGFRTTLVWTINLRALNNFLRLRLDKHVFIEMRKFAEEVQNIAKNTKAGFLVYSMPEE